MIRKPVWKTDCSPDLLQASFPVAYEQIQGQWGGQWLKLLDMAEIMCQADASLR